MQGKKELKQKLLYQLSISDLVPEQNYYRRIDRELELQFIYRVTKKYYGREGQDSIDPVVFFKILLVGYLNNIGSDRRLIEFCSDSLAIRLFLRYDIDEQLPWHSTISRTRKLLGEEVFLELFRQMLSLCISNGMVRGKRQAVDSAFIKANASLYSLKEKEILEDAEFYAEELNDNSDHKVSKSRKKSVEEHLNWKKEAYKGMPGHRTKREVRTDGLGKTVRSKFLSNHTHYSPTDPDVKIAVKPGKASQMNYYGQLAVDDAKHVITGACADFADQRDSQCVEKLVGQAHENLKEHDMELEQVLADAGYSSGEALKYLESKNIDAWIPNFGLYKPDREGFTYDKENYRYVCALGKNLEFKKIGKSPKGDKFRLYRSSRKDCKECPLRSSCIGKSFEKTIRDTTNKEYYDRMHQKIVQSPNYAKKMSKIRSRTVEPVLGTLINYMNMRRVNTRGIKQANKHVLMAALTYNLKKYLKFNQRKPNVQVNFMAMNVEKGKYGLKTCLIYFKKRFFRYSDLQINLLRFLTFFSKEYFLEGCATVTLVGKRFFIFFQCNSTS